MTLGLWVMLFGSIKQGLRPKKVSQKTVANAWSEVGKESAVMQHASQTPFLPSLPPTGLDKAGDKRTPILEKCF